MKVNIKEYIEKILTHLDIDVIPFIISIDSKKRSKNISLSSAHKCIVGYSSPNHVILINNKSIKYFLLLLNRKGLDMVHAEEVKVAVVIFQKVPNGMCPYMTLCGRPQTSNESSTLL